VVPSTDGDGGSAGGAAAGARAETGGEAGDGADPASFDRICSAATTPVATMTSAANAIVRACIRTDTVTR
jgi:hypothetical protein